MSYNGLVRRFLAASVPAPPYPGAFGFFTLRRYLVSLDAGVRRSFPMSPEPHALDHGLSLAQFNRPATHRAARRRRGLWPRLYVATLVIDCIFQRLASRE